MSTVNVIICCKMTHGLVHEIHDFEQFTGEIGLAEIGEIHCAK